MAGAGVEPARPCEHGILSPPILNKNSSLSYSAATADYIELRDIDRSLEQATGESKSLFVFANVKGGIIDGVNAATNTTAMTGSLLDLYACVKLHHGGRIGSGQRDREHLVRRALPLHYDDGRRGHCGLRVSRKTRNISVNGKAVGGTSAVKHGTLASAFPLNDGSTSGAYAAVEDVQWLGEFETSNFRDYVLRFGRTEDVGQVCRNVKAIKCRFRVKQSEVRTSYVVRVIKNVGDGNTVEGCHIDATGSPQVITHAIAGADRATGNTTLGSLTNAATSCKLVDGPSLK